MLLFIFFSNYTLADTKFQNISDKELFCKYNAAKKLNHIGTTRVAHTGIRTRAMAEGAKSFENSIVSKLANGKLVPVTHYLAKKEISDVSENHKNRYEYPGIALGKLESSLKIGYENTDDAFSKFKDLYIEMCNNDFKNLSIPKLSNSFQEECVRIQNNSTLSQKKKDSLSTNEKEFARYHCREFAREFFAKGKATNWLMDTSFNPSTIDRLALDYVREYEKRISSNQDIDINKTCSSNINSLDRTEDTSLKHHSRETREAIDKLNKVTPE